MRWPTAAPAGQNDQVRFELTVMALNPRLRTIAPAEWTIRSRKDALDYAAEYNVPVTATEKSIYSRDRNIWHLSHEGGLLEDPWTEPEEAMYQWSVRPGRRRLTSRRKLSLTSRAEFPSASMASPWGRLAC